MRFIQMMKMHPDTCDADAAEKNAIILFQPRSHNDCFIQEPRAAAAAGPKQPDCGTHQPQLFVFGLYTLMESHYIYHSC